MTPEDQFTLDWANGRPVYEALAAYRWIVLHEAAQKIRAQAQLLSPDVTDYPMTVAEAAHLIDPNEE